MHRDATTTPLTRSFVALVNFTTPVANGDGVVADPQNPATAWTPGAGTKQLVAVEAYQIVPAGKRSDKSSVEPKTVLLT